MACSKALANPLILSKIFDVWDVSMVTTGTDLPLLLLHASILHGG